MNIHGPCQASCCYKPHNTQVFGAYRVNGGHIVMLPLAIIYNAEDEVGKKDLLGRNPTLSFLFPLRPISPVQHNPQGQSITVAYKNFFFF